MSKFISFDGIKYLNLDVVKEILFVDEMKIIDCKEYAFCNVFVDGELFYSTRDYKYYDEGAIDGKLEDFHKETKRLREVISV